MKAPSAHEQITSLARFRGVATWDVWRAYYDASAIEDRRLAFIEIARRYPIHRKWDPPLTVQDAQPLSWR
jgi:hypothetical protein